MVSLFISQPKWKDTSHWSYMPRLIGQSLSLTNDCRLVDTLDEADVVYFMAGGRSSRIDKQVDHCLGSGKAMIAHYDDTYNPLINLGIPLTALMVLDKQIWQDKPLKFLPNVPLIEVPMWSVSYPEFELTFNERLTRLEKLAWDCIYVGTPKKDRLKLMSKYPSLTYRSGLARTDMAQEYKSSLACMVMTSDTHYRCISPRVIESLSSTVTFFDPDGFKFKYFDLLDPETLDFLKVESDEELLAKMDKLTNYVARSWILNHQANWLDAILKAEYAKLASIDLSTLLSK